MGTTVNVVAGDITDFPTPALVVNLFQGVTQPGGATGAIDQALGGAINTLIADGEIKGKLGELTLLHTMGRIRASRVVVVGLGKSDGFDAGAVRRVSGDVARFLRRKGVGEFATIAHGAGIGGLDARESGQAIAEGTVLGLYKFDDYRSDGNRDGADGDETVERHADIATVTIVERNAGNVDALRSGVAVGTVLAEATTLARDLVNHPANVMTPTRMADAAREVATSAGLELDVIERDRMTQHGMGALLGVAQGSEEPPMLIVLTYRGDPENPDNNLGLVGKGITFDTGGISLKPAANMEAMKGDMAGGASVIAAMRAIGNLKPRINVTGLIAATENMPGGRAQRPGDVVTAMNGKTPIEVINTDAEGRLVLADALCYARQLGLTRLVDVATLTGAMVVTLGKACTGIMGNSSELADSVRTAGDSSGERFWELPMLEDYRELINSDVADMKNTGGRQAGSITAAMLLREFAEDADWVHLDIAGTSTASSNKGHLVKGATGVPTRTLAQLAMNLAKGN